MYEKEKQQLIDCAREMQRYGLVVLSGGNVSMRMPCGNFLVTPSAMSYDTMTTDDIVPVSYTHLSSLRTTATPRPCGN